MARTPRASVSKTSGQGVSRLAYQKAYRMKGGPAIKGPGAVPSDSRSYAKGKAAATPVTPGDIAYGEDQAPADVRTLQDLQDLRDTAPAKPSLNFSPGKQKKVK